LLSNDQGKRGKIRQHKARTQNMKTQQTTTTQKCRRGTAMWIGMSMGTAIGAGVGVAMNNMAMGVALGVAAGSAVGAFWTFTKTNSD